ncbi:MAG: FxsA family protein [Pirellulaceae bacterium]|nr:FxsA family protein [Pirellulaceae bacterium]
MLGRLLLLFISVPLVELVLLLVIADHTNWKFTVSLVIITGIVGSVLARSQGFRTVRKIQEQLAAGHLPTAALLDALMIFIAGAFLLTPGVLTDLFGMTLLIPTCRKFYRRSLSHRFKKHFQFQQFSPSQQASRQEDSEVIDSYVVEKQSDE